MSTRTCREYKSRDGESSEEALDELHRCIRRQKRGEEVFTREKRFPRCLFEDLGKSVIVLPSRLTYGFEASVQGYYELKSTEDASLEACLFEKSVDELLESGNFISKEVGVIDLGGGSGSKGAQIAMTLMGRGHEVRYTCVDGSPRMLRASQVRMKKLGIQCQSKLLCFEAFPSQHLSAFRPKSGGMILLLFLGCTYGNYDPVDIGGILNNNPTYEPTDLVVIGTGTAPQQEKGEFVQETLMEYWNPVMRLALLEAIGFRKAELHNHVAYNPQREQFEMYMFVREVSDPILRGLGIVPGDIFLTGVARRPSRDQLRGELSKYFDTQLSFDDARGPFHTVALCRPRPTRH
jgi:uncharacterized SAM-dependent methyltransferase